VIVHNRGDEALDVVGFVGIFGDERVQTLIFAIGVVVALTGWRLF
jgi:hypothetical protein